MTAPVVAPLTPDPNAPSYTLPLTPAERLAILAYIAQRQNSTVAAVAGIINKQIVPAAVTVQGTISGAFGGILGGNSSAAATAADTTILQDYDAVVAGGGFGAGLGNTSEQLQTPSLTSFLGDLTNGATWVRVAEFLVGGIMLAIAINALVKNTSGVNPAGTVRKVGKGPVGALSGGIKSGARNVASSGARSSNTSYKRDSQGLLSSSSTRGDVNSSRTYDRPARPVKPKPAPRYGKTSYYKRDDDAGVLARSTRRPSQPAPQVDLSAPILG